MDFLSLLFTFYFLLFSFLQGIKNFYPPFH